MTSTFAKAAIAAGLLATTGVLAGTATPSGPVSASSEPVAATRYAADRSGDQGGGAARTTTREPAGAARSAHRRPLTADRPGRGHRQARPAARDGRRHGRPSDYATGGRSHARNQAAPRRTGKGHRPSFAARASRVMAVARAQRGKPYVWGAAGPRGFDCSGFVQWVFRHAVGRHLPKYTDTQWAVLEHIRRHELRRGDLVFVGGGPHKSHVGIYAGHWQWWVAPRTGSHVQKQRIWPAKHTFARVLPTTSR